MANQFPPTVLVTGTGSGIGEACAKRQAGMGLPDRLRDWVVARRFS